MFENDLKNYQVTIEFKDKTTRKIEIEGTRRTTSQDAIDHVTSDLTAVEQSLILTISAKELVKLNWNCQGHEYFKQGCEDCEQMTREMQPEYCVIGMGLKDNPHDWLPGGNPEYVVCSKCKSIIKKTLVIKR
jgi:hypothetical protein